jgi:prolipoprotein diacylglyceryltransferase
MAPLAVWHFVFEALAYAVGFALYRRLRRRGGDVVPGTARSSVIVAAILGAAIGSKLLFWFEDPALTLRNWNNAGYLMGGKTIVGGLLGGTLAVEWIKARHGITQRTGNLFTLPLIVGIAIGRVGCYFGGLEDHTYGVATSLPWGVDFGDGVSRHPTQLYEVLFLGGLALMMLRMRAALPEGGQFRAFLILYMLWRLVIDFLKPGVFLGGMTALQWCCALSLAWYLRDAPAWFLPRREVAHG